MNRRRENHGTHQAGFTLLELVVALTILVVMAVGVWTALTMCINAWTRGIEAIDLNQRERNSHDLVRKQIASAYPVLPSSIGSSVGAQNPILPIIAAGTPIFSGGETSLRFVSPNSLLSVDSAGLVLVTYEVGVDSSNNIFLVQREAPYVGQSVEDGWFTSSTYVFYNLKELTFEYYDTRDGEEEAAEWLTEWDTAGKRRLPAAVRISMLYNDAGRGSQGMQMVIPLHAQYAFQNQPMQQFIQRRQTRALQSKAGRQGQQTGSSRIEQSPLLGQ